MNDLPKNSEAKHWCITVNNPTDVDRAAFLIHRQHVDYYILANETGVDGTPHIQGYICFKKKRKLSVLKKMFPRAHFEVKRGTVAEAITYCKKGEQPKEEWELHKSEGPSYGLNADFMEYGEVPEEQTAKAHKESLARYEDTVAKAKANRLDEVSADHYLKYYSSLKKIRSDHKNKTLPPDLSWRRDLGDCPNIWIWGEKDTGKSRDAREILSKLPSWYYKMNNKWWDQYEDDDGVLIEDVGKTHEWMGDFMKIWADRYAFRAENKFGTAVLRPKIIIVTSNYHPKEIWPDENVHQPILDRFKLVFKEKLNEFDVSPVIPARRKKVKVDKVKKKMDKPPLYRQNAEGNLKRYREEQTKLSHLYDLTEDNPKGKALNAIVTEKTGDLNVCISISDSESCDIGQMGGFIEDYEETTESYESVD